MQFSAIVVALFAAAAVATPAPELAGRQTYVPCSGLSSSAQCCSTDVLGVADLDCASPSSTPTSAANFSSVCSASGKTAKCCTLPVLGQSLVCSTPSGL